MCVSPSPNPFGVAWSVWRSLRTVRPSRPIGSEGVDHRDLAESLRELASRGSKALVDLTEPLASYVTRMESVDPDRLTPPEGLAMWINLYNAGALLLAGKAIRRGEDSVLRLPGGFGQPFVTIDGEQLSLDAVEHAKLRRLGDARIHGALVCGSVSCPTLRSEPYDGPSVSAQLDDQLRRLLAGGALIVDEPGRAVWLSRVFLWYGADFVRPHRMPSFIPARRTRILRSLQPWLDPAVSAWIDKTGPRIEFQDYDWGLACRVG
jgi:hypothetical protein